MSLFHLNFRPPHRLPIRPNGRRHGRQRDMEDLRDYKFTRAPTGVLAATLDLSLLPYMPGVYDQGDVGDCVEFGCAGCCYEFDQRKQGLIDYIPSFLQLYWCVRLSEGASAVHQDCGSTIREGIKALAKYGVANGALWPYIQTKWNVAPPANVMTDALTHKAINYESVSNANETQLKNALSLGFPVVFGTTLYPSFESDEVAGTGVVPMPDAADLKAGTIGGHCMTLVGWTTTMAKVR